VSDDDDELRALAKAMLEASRAETKHRKEVLKSIPKGRAGRPARSTSMTPLAVATNSAVLEVLTARKEYCARTGRGNVPAIVTEKYIKDACKKYPPANIGTVTNRVARKDFKRLRSKATSQKV